MTPVTNNMTPVTNIQNVAPPQATIQSNRNLLSKIVDVALKVFKKIKEAFADCMDAFVAFKAKVTGLLSRANTVRSTPRQQAISEAPVISINAAKIIQKSFREYRSRVANPVKSEKVESAPLAPVTAGVTSENTVNQSKNLKYGTAALAVVAAATGAVLLKQNPEALNQILKDSKVLAGLASETGARLSDKFVNGVFSGVKVAGEVARKIVAENFPNIQPIRGGFAYNFSS